MNNENSFFKVSGIKYCTNCKRFYLNVCYCVQHLTNKNNESSKNSLNLVTKFIYILFVIYNYGNKLVRCEKDFDVNSSNCKLEKKNQQYLRGFCKNRFSKYINLCHFDENNFASNGNFYIYMMTNSEDDNKHDARTKQRFGEDTTKHEGSDNTSQSSCSLASKKSASGSVLSRITKSLRRRRKLNVEELHGPKIDEKQLQCPTTVQKFSRSKIPILKTKQKQCKVFTNPQSSGLLQELTFTSSKTRQEADPPQKFASDDTVNKIKEEPREINEEVCLNQNICGIQLPQQLHNGAMRPQNLSQIPASFPASNTCLNLNLTDKLREVINICQRLEESESNLARLISSYITDQHFKEELLSVLTSHAKLHIDTERRAQYLAHEIWLEQNDSLKTQKSNLESKMEGLVEQNRKLKEEIENLVSANEKIHISNEKQFLGYMKPPLADSYNSLIENLTRNNDKLRFKIKNVSNELDEEEKRSHRFELKIQQLEQELGNIKSLMQNYKINLHRTETAYQLQLAEVNHRYQLSQMINKETAEAGDVLLEDLDALKRQMKSTTCTINWTKFKSRGSNLPDLIYMCRSFMNELAKELMKSYTDSLLKDKDIVGLSEKSERLVEKVERSILEQDLLRNRLKRCEEREVELKKYMEKCSSLERELGECKQQMERVNGEFEKEKLSFIASVDDVESLNKKIIEKEEELILTSDKMCEYKSDNDALRMQIHGLKQVLAASGAGDIARELADIQEKLTFFQSQYYQLLSEKNYMMEQLQAANVERGSLNRYQNNYYQYIQIQQQDLELLNRDNTVLQKELEVQRNECFLLKAERAKLKEEKNVMRHIYQQLKTEITKVQKLQGEVNGINIEANRLAIIAEYNKQLGEKLQVEVAERDVKISELQSSVQQLNSAQVENSKDKVALCVELTEVCTLNNQLNSSLAVEQNKTTYLDESKKKLENTANTQLKVVEQMQKAERAALKELLNDFKNVVAQRDNILSSQNEYQQQISDLRQNALTQTRVQEELGKKNKKLTEQVQKFKTKLGKSEEERKKTLGEMEEKQQISTRLEEEITQLKNESKTLHESKMYLQNTVQKLHSDLNESRKNELDAKQAIKKDVKKLEQLEEALSKTKSTLCEISGQNQAMLEEAASFNGSYTKLAMDYEADMLKATAVREELRKNLENSQELIQVDSKEIESLKQVIEDRDSKINELQHYSKNLEGRLKQTEASLEDIDTQSKLLVESNMALVQLQNNFRLLESEHQQYSQTLTTLAEEKLKLYTEFKTYVTEMEEKHSELKDYLQNLMMERDEQKQLQEVEIEILSSRIVEIRNTYKIEKEANENLQEAHKDLAGKLLKAVKMLIEEKIDRQKAETHIIQITNENRELSLEKEAAEKLGNLLSGQLDELKTRVGCLIADKKTLENTLSDLQELYTKSQSRCRLLEQKLQLQNVKMKKRSVSTPSNKIASSKDTRSKLQSTEERSKKLRNELEKSHKAIMQLNKEISSLKQQLTVMEFQKCETALRLHETEGKLKTEQSINLELIGTNQHIVREIIQMTRDDVITQPASEALLWLIQEKRPINLNNLNKSN